MARPDRPDFSALELGRTHDPIEVDDSDTLREACLALIAQARREILIFSRHLDPVLFDNAQASETLRRFVLQGRRTGVRMLVKNPEPAVRTGHRFIELAQRLSSFVEIRVPAHEHDAFNAAFVVADGVGAVYRSLSDRYEASVTFGDRVIAMELRRQFEPMWQTSARDPGLQRLHL